MRQNVKSNSTFENNVEEKHASVSPIRSAYLMTIWTLFSSTFFLTAGLPWANIGLMCWTTLQRGTGAALEKAP